MDSVFTENELEIFRSWVLNKKNKEIAEEMKTSEAYVSQTIKKIQEKLNTLENSLNMLKQMTLMKPKEDFKLTQKGKEHAEKDKEKFREKSRNKLKNNWETFGGLRTTRIFLDKSGDLTVPNPNYMWGTIGGNPEKQTAESYLTRFYAAEIAEPATSIMDLTKAPSIKVTMTSTKSNSELEFHIELLNLISKRMINSMLTSETTSLENSVMITKLKDITHNLYQIIEWLNSRGQLQQSRAR